ncbi:MAG: tRNA-intron lyase [archaeon GB-1867-097]|nr:tRNA-intron lyase [Candidatus Culexmicrobium thermophilum]MCS7385031.1 tRNA-intron lyase [Candidatus Culexmicrobium thermophilum]
MVSEQIVAYLMPPRIIVWDVKSARRLYGEGFFGSPIKVKKPKDIAFNSPLELSFFETLYLLREGKIKVLDASGIELSEKNLVETARKYYELFDDLYLVYKDLRDKGYVVRPGLKFGADFAVYQYGPGIDHAPFLVDVLPLNSKIDPISIVRAGRLSHSVRKKFVIAFIDPETGKVRYFMFKWFRA